MFHRQHNAAYETCLNSQLAGLEKAHISTPSPDLLRELLCARTALNTFLIHDSEQSLGFVRLKMYVFGEKPGRYLANLVMKRAVSQNIVSITYSNGVRSFNTRTINKYSASFYSNLHGSKQPNVASLMRQFFADLRFPKVTEDQKLQLDALITRE